MSRRITLRPSACFCGVGAAHTRPPARVQTGPRGRCPASPDKPRATTTEIQLALPLDTSDQVLFLLPVCGGVGTAGAMEHVR